MDQKMGRNEACWCGSNKKYKKCHEAIDTQMFAQKDMGHEVPGRRLIKSAAQIQGIKDSSKLNIALLDDIASFILPGASSLDIDSRIHTKTLEMGGIPAPLNYEGFPKSVCISINDVVCHGIPSPDMVLQDGDIVNIDVSTIYNGYFSDSSRMFCVGDVSRENKRLVDVAKLCMEEGIAAIKPWGFLGDVGEAVNNCAIKHGYSVVREIGGHGIGLEFHEDPFVSYVTKRGTGMVLVPGLTFTVEPMINMGTPEIFIDGDDEWTVFTADGKPSAQWEKTVVVTETGYELLTF